jgi:hypothetical protein
VSSECRDPLRHPFVCLAGSAARLAGRALAAIDKRLPAEAWSLGREAFGIIAYAVGSAADADYARMLGLRGTAEFALRVGELDRAAALARELLAIAERFRADFDYGNAVHHGHLLLGRVALRRGDRSAAGEELLAAGRTRGSPQLNSFGPNMGLARELLHAGDREVVLQYFELCSKFWMPPFGTERLAEWAAQVRSGTVPDFKANLIY